MFISFFSFFFFLIKKNANQVEKSFLSWLLLRRRNEVSRASATDTTDPADTSKLQCSPGMLLVPQVLVQKWRQEKLIAIQISLKAKAVWVGIAR